MSEPVIRMENIIKRYYEGKPNELQILNGINLEVNEGEFVSIVGESGSGKSTMMNIIGVLDRQSEGNYFLEGRDVNLLSDDERSTIRNNRIGFVFQNFNLLPRANALKNVMVPLMYNPKRPKNGQEKAMEMLKMVGMEDRASHRPNELSGGQKRRVAIAGVMAMRPEILILDEPTASLDPHGRDRILDIIKEYHRITNSTVMIVSHSMEDIAKYAEKILVMNKSELFCYDTVQNVFRRSAEIEKMGLDVPQITKVFNRLKELGISVDDEIYTTEYAKDVVLGLLRERGI